MINHFKLKRSGAMYHLLTSRWTWFRLLLSFLLWQIPTMSRTDGAVTCKFTVRINHMTPSNSLHMPITLKCEKCESAWNGYRPRHTGTHTHHGLECKAIIATLTQHKPHWVWESWVSIILTRVTYYIYRVNKSAPLGKGPFLTYLRCCIELSKPSGISLEMRYVKEISMDAAALQ